MTTPQAFQTSLSDAAPPDGASLALQALWWAGKDEWDRAHACVQLDKGNSDCDQVHGYLHRVEGDLDNARYWYGRAGCAFPAMSLTEEYTAITTRLLART